MHASVDLAERLPNFLLGKRHETKSQLTDAKFYRMWTLDIPVYRMIQTVCSFIIYVIIILSIISLDSNNLYRYESFICPVEGAFLFGTGFVENCTYGVLNRRCTWDKTVVLTKNSLNGVKIFFLIHMVLVCFFNIFRMVELFFLILNSRRKRTDVQITDSDTDSHRNNKIKKVQEFLSASDWDKLENVNFIEKNAKIVSLHYPYIVLTLVSWGDVTGKFTCPRSSQLTSFALQNVLICIVFGYIIVICNILSGFGKHLMLLGGIKQALSFLILYQVSGILASFNPDAIYQIMASTNAVVVCLLFAIPMSLRIAWDIDFKSKRIKLLNDKSLNV